MYRLLYNRAILRKLFELVEKHPYLRFGQLLTCCKIIQYEKSVLCDGQREDILTIDPFYEEPELTWNRMKSNEFCFPENKIDSN